MLSVELVLTVPILMALVLALVQFSIMLASSQTISAAANVAARQATIPSASAASVEAAVAQVVHGWQFAGHQEVIILVNGVPEASSPLEDAVTGDVISVKVRVPTIEASPDLLDFIGTSISGQYLQSTFVMRKE